MIDELTLRCGDEVVPDEYRALLAAVGWRPPDADDAQLQRALAATWNVTARTAEGRLVGVARVRDDGVLYASVWDVLVEPTLQRRGIGRALMAHVLEHTADRRLVSLIDTAALDQVQRVEPRAALPPLETVLALADGWGEAMREGDIAAAQREVLPALIERGVPMRVGRGRYAVEIVWTPLGEELRAAITIPAELTKRAEKACAIRSA